MPAATLRSTAALIRAGLVPPRDRAAVGAVE